MQAALLVTEKLHRLLMASFWHLHSSYIKADAIAERWHPELCSRITMAPAGEQ
jgi:hypothetical protein